jgi:hypothetical protein
MSSYAKQKDHRKRALYWAGFIGVALLLHLILFIGIKQGFFEVFRTDVDQAGGASGSSASYPDAIIAIEIEIDDGEEEPVTDPTETTTPTPPTDDPSDNTRQSRGDNPLEINVDALTGEATFKIPADGGGGGRETAVPPRPVEITWPETKGLGHCLGLEIAIRIEVDREGEVLQVKAMDDSQPGDCTKAALDAARQIRFRPGLVKGRPAPT